MFWPGGVPPAGRGGPPMMPLMMPVRPGMPQMGGMFPGRPNMPGVMGMQQNPQMVQQQSFPGMGPMSGMPMGPGPNFSGPPPPPM
eukprot:6468255-Pyramimonas_sp.AAC.1